MQPAMLAPTTATSNPLSCTGASLPALGGGRNLGRGENLARTGGDQPLADRRAQLRGMRRVGDCGVADPARAVRQAHERARAAGRPRCAPRGAHGVWQVASSRSTTARSAVRLTSASWSVIAPRSSATARRRGAPRAPGSPARAPVSARPPAAAAAPSLAAESPQAGEREHHRVEAPLLETAQPRVDVAAQIAHVEVGPRGEQLCPAAQAARADRRALRQIVERSRAHERVARVLALGHADDREAVGQLARARPSRSARRGRPPRRAAPPRSP